MRALSARTYVELGAVGIVAYFTVPGLMGNWALYSAIGLSASVAIAVGLRRYHPAATNAWWLFSAALVVMVVGDVIMFANHGAFPSIADVFYLASYPLLAGGLVLLVRNQSPGRDLAALLDASIVTVGLAVLAWVFLMEPYTLDKDVTVIERYVSMAYPMMDVLLLGVAIRLTLNPGNRSPAFFLVAGSMALLLAADTAYGVAQVTFGYGDSTSLDFLWLLSYLLLGAAALHPSMRSLTHPVVGDEVGLGRSRMIVLGCVLIITPTLQAVRPSPHGGGRAVIYLGASLLSILVLARIMLLVRGLRSAVANYEVAARAKEDFVSTVSHELRTPLTSILGHVELLNDGEAGELGPEQRHMVDIIDRNGQRLLKLIEDLLTLNSVEVNRLRLALAPTDLEKLLAGLRATVAPDADRRGIALAYEVASDLGMVTLDARAVDRAVLNLLSNALKFTPAGGQVTLRAEREAETVTIAVSDTGIGIPEEEQENLFSRFYRTTAATELAIPGTGLGLSIVKAIIEEHKGTITVESEEGVGTTLSIRLPAGDAPPAERAAVLEAQPRDQRAGRVTPTRQ